MSQPKPAHLGPEYADQFSDEAIAEAYVQYPPYSSEVFETLTGLIQDSPRIVLDVGCGTGELARPLAASVDRIDAVDQSAAMIRIGRGRDGGDRSNIRWICQSAEAFPYENGYSLIVAGASIHWMDWEAVLPRMAASLSPRGCLAIVGGHEIAAPWSERLNNILPRYSTNKEFGRFSVIDELEERHLFSVAGSVRTAPQQHQMRVDQYVELLHARNGFSRQRMDPQTADEFDTTVRELVAPFLQGDTLSLDMASTITWGHPEATSSAGH